MKPLLMKQVFSGFYSTNYSVLSIIAIHDGFNQPALYLMTQSPIQLVRSSLYRFTCFPGYARSSIIPIAFHIAFSSFIC